MTYPRRDLTRTGMTATITGRSRLDLGKIYRGFLTLLGFHPGPPRHGYALAEFCAPAWHLSCKYLIVVLPRTVTTAGDYARGLVFGKTAGAFADQKRVSKMAPARWEGVVRFGVSGNFSHWARSGWSRPEPNHTWMDGYQAELEFGMAPPNSDQVLAAKLLSVTSPMQQHLYVYLNGYLIGMFVARSDGSCECSSPVSRDFFEKSNRNVLTFVCPHAIIPADEGLGADQRRLSFAFVELSLLAAS